MATLPSTKLNTNYLKFDSESMKKFINQKLAEDDYFTDQVFEGSNLAILIDTFAYMFESYMYNLNHGASEGMFSDTQYYENMNRIVKLLGYNPLGYIAPITQCVLKTKDDETILTQTRFLPKYSYVQVPNLTDASGKSVYYSITNYPGIEINLSFNSDTNDYELSYDDSPKVALTNGRWKAYNHTFISQGLPFEEFTLDLIDMKSTTNPRYISHPYVDVYIRRTSSTGDEFIRYTPVTDSTLFGKGVNVSGPKDKIFELRLNEYMQYVIRFGDGIHGTRLQPNDEIYVVYLEGNGKLGEIGNGLIDTESEASTVFKFGIEGLNNDIVKQMIGYTTSTDNADNIYFDVDSNATTNYGKLTSFNIFNIDPSTKFIASETVDSIRFNAPEAFKSNGRLVTTDDYKYYIRKTYRGTIEDVYVMNNSEYMASFMFWLYKYNMMNESIRRDYYIYADSCDFNNVYIWTKWNIELERFDFIERDIFSKKCLTAEPIILNALDVVLVPCLKYKNTAGEMLYDFNSWDSNCENFIEITKDKNTIIPAEQIKKNVIKVITDHFYLSNCSMGMTINVSNLYNKILLLDGVREVKTGYLANGDVQGNTQYYNGLSFALWTPKIMNGADVDLFTGNYKLNNFQFPRLIDDAILQLTNRIKIVVNSFVQASVEY